MEATFDGKLDRFELGMAFCKHPMAANAKGLEVMKAQFDSVEEGRTFATQRSARWGEAVAVKVRSWNHVIFPSVSAYEWLVCLADTVPETRAIEIRITGVRKSPRWETLEAVLQDATGHEDGKLIKIDRRGTAGDYGKPGVYDLLFKHEHGKPEQTAVVLTVVEEVSETAKEKEACL